MPMASSPTRTGRLRTSTRKPGRCSTWTPTPTPPKAAARSHSKSFLWSWSVRFGQFHDLYESGLAPALFLLNRGVGMKRRSFLYSSGVLLGATMLGSHDSHADQTHAHVRHAAALMTDCANRFLAALDDKQRGKATFHFDADERMNWHFIPKERKGLPLREMSPFQKHLASALLAAGLSQTGY